MAGRQGEKRYHYITLDDYAKAEQNGLSKRLVNQRVREYCWDVDKAITEPKQTRDMYDWTNWKNKAVVSYPTFTKRIREGWTKEKAAMTPSQRRGDNAKPILVTDEVIERAAANGIGVGTLKMRIYDGKWDIEKAVTTPVMSKYEASQLAAAARKGKYKKGGIGRERFC